MKSRDLSKYILKHPYFKVRDYHYRVQGMDSYKMYAVCLNTGKEYYWYCKQCFTNHKQQIKDFMSLEEFTKKHPELVI